jgi:hypothetical protein
VRMTQFFTRSPYTHVGVAVWEESGLYLAELNRGANHLTPMSQIAHKGFDVYAPPEQCRDFREAVFSQLRVNAPYSILAAFVIGFLEFFRINIFVHWRKEMVCSGFVVAIYEAAGWEGPSRVISPGKLAKMLRKMYIVNAKA